MSNKIKPSNVKPLKYEEWMKKRLATKGIIRHVIDTRLDDFDGIVTIEKMASLINRHCAG